jgi:hypothetical protein
MAQIAILAVKALAALNQGAQERKLHYQEAEGLRDARNRKMATTTAGIAEAEREKEHMYSRALAVSAASGAGVDDPGMVSLFGDLNAEGEYRILAQLYTGSSEAEGIGHQSLMAMKAGDSALQASYVKAATTVISAFAGDSDMFGGFSQKNQMKKGLALAKPTGEGIRDYAPLNPNVRYA